MGLCECAGLPLTAAIPQKVGKTLFSSSLGGQGTDGEVGKHPALGHIPCSCPELNPACCLIGYRINSSSPAPQSQSRDIKVLYNHDSLSLPLLAQLCFTNVSGGSPTALCGQPRGVRREQRSSQTLASLTAGC